MYLVDCVHQNSDHQFHTHTEVKIFHNDQEKTALVSAKTQNLGIVIGLVMKNGIGASLIQACF